jgi:hypothetical protein
MNTEPRWTFEYTAKLRKQWQSSREIAKKWYEQYPFFHPEDYRSAQNQHDYHFFEWYAAVLIYEKTGAFSLIEKYDLTSHPRKLCILRELMTPEQIDALDRADRPCQPPDLLVYRPNLRNFYFCEVKGPNDYLRPVQKRFFNRLERNVGKPVHIAEFREV